MEQLGQFIGNHLILVTSFAALLVMFFMTGSSAARHGYTEITPQEATALTNRENAVLIDTREATEYADGHIVNAIHVPVSDVDSQVGKLEKYKSRPVIAYCRSGHRSGSTCRQLHKAGFEKVYNLRGGIMAWERDKLPVTKA
jgi:rhodanese-related sulfurtransferase